MDIFERLVTCLHAEIASATDDPYLRDTEHSYLSTWQHWFDTHVDWDKGIVLLAEESGSTVGLVGGHLGSPMLPSPHVAVIGFIALCWVDPHYRHRGMARQMVFEIEQWFKEKGVAYVDVDYMVQNTASAEVWRALGYQPYRAAARKAL